MMSITADDIVKLFEEDVKARKRMAELLVVEPDIRLAIINAVLRDVATKQDIKDMATKQDITELRKALEAKIEREINRLEREIDGLEKEIDRLFKLVLVSVLCILISITTTILVRILLP
ncbi:MAG: hypothetical protein J7K82_02830 [Thermoproteales archaeon]|nr:hypothetical protein [Thermoproteales archaeon]